MKYHNLAVGFRKKMVNVIYSKNKQDITDFELYVVRRWLDMFKEDII